VGIEHASTDKIREALNTQAYEPTEKNTDLTHVDLMRYGLVGHKGSKQKRDYLCRQLAIGLANGKTLLKKLDMFGITKEDIEKVIE